MIVLLRWWWIWCGDTGVPAFDLVSFEFPPVGRRHGVFLVDVGIGEAKPYRRIVPMTDKELSGVEGVGFGEGDAHLFGHDTAAVGTGVTKDLEGDVAEDDAVEFSTHTLTDDLAGEGEVEAIFPRLGEDDDQLVGNEVLGLVDDEPNGSAVCDGARTVEGDGEHHGDDKSSDGRHGVRAELAGSATEDDGFATVERLLEVD